MRHSAANASQSGGEKDTEKGEEDFLLSDSLEFSRGETFLYKAHLNKINRVTIKCSLNLKITFLKTIRKKKNH